MEIDLVGSFREPKLIKHLADELSKISKDLPKPINIMEVCGGHTHSIMKYGLPQLMPNNINFIHGPGCPVCVMPKGRIDHAFELANMQDTILVTLGDMIKVPGSKGSLQKARSLGADVRFVYSPMDTLKIATENPTKNIVFFAIGFETTTPMTCALIAKTLQLKIKNLFFHINHITVPEPMMAILDDTTNKIDAFIGPSHVSVITGSKIYEQFATKYKKPLVVGGFEPVDIMESILMIVRQIIEKRCELEVQYSRSVTYDGNQAAQKLVEKFLEKREMFEWRGLGEIPLSGLKLKNEFEFLDAEIVFAKFLPQEKQSDNKNCICGSILKGQAKPYECKVFGTACTPSNPLGSCMVSSEGACSAYFKYGKLNFLK